MNLELLENAVLKRGGHPDGSATCARELIHLIVTGVHADATPECLTVTLSALPVLNDGPWASDEERTAALLPWIPRLLECTRDPEVDQRRTYALADYAVRTIAGVDCGPIVDAESAEAAAEVAGEADETEVFAGRAAWAARSARAAEAWAVAAWAARAQAEAPEAAWAQSADSSLWRQHVDALLRIIVETR